MEAHHDNDWNVVAKHPVLTIGAFCLGAMAIGLAIGPLLSWGNSAGGGLDANGDGVLDQLAAEADEPEARGDDSAEDEGADTTTTGVPGPVNLRALPMTEQVNGSFTEQVTIGSRTYDRPLFFSYVINSRYTEASFYLGKRFSRLEMKFGATFDSTRGKHVTLEVLRDNVLVDSWSATSTDEAIEISIDVAGANLITFLPVEEYGSGDTYAAIVDAVLYP